MIKFFSLTIPSYKTSKEKEVWKCSLLLVSAFVSELWRKIGVLFFSWSLPPNWIYEVYSSTLRSVKLISSINLILSWITCNKVAGLSPPLINLEKIVLKLIMSRNLNLSPQSPNSFVPQCERFISFK